MVVLLQIVQVAEHHLSQSVEVGFVMIEKVQPSLFFGLA
jgi:hypothetical protein